MNANIGREKETTVGAESGGNRRGTWERGVAGGHGRGGVAGRHGRGAPEGDM